MRDVAPRHRTLAYATLALEPIDDVGFRARVVESLAGDAEPPELWRPIDAEIEVRIQIEPGTTIGIGDTLVAASLSPSCEPRTFRFVAVFKDGPVGHRGS